MRDCVWMLGCGWIRDCWRMRGVDALGADAVGADAVGADAGGADAGGADE